MIKKKYLNSSLVKARICDGLSEDVARKLAELQVLETTSSTNDQVMEDLRSAKKSYVVCVANRQTGGRGRNGSVWQSPPEANIYLSVGCSFGVSMVNSIGGLSLACGVSVARLLSLSGFEVGLKWPNDVLIKGKKLAGILVESRVSAKQVNVVVGIGLNVKMSNSAAQKIDQPWTDLSSESTRKNEIEIEKAKVPAGLDRNYWVAELINVLVRCLSQYKESMFESFADDWKKYEILTGRNVVVKTGEAWLDATVLGYDENFALRLSVDGEQKSYFAADIKLKLESNVSN